MSKRRLNLVQSNFRQGPKQLNAYFLPYTAGVLWSYARSQKDISDSWQLGELVFKRVDIDADFQRLADCDVIGFSNYIWSKSHNYLLAERIKQHNPKCIVVFGGPETPLTDQGIFEKLPFIDVIVKQEGEIAFADILRNPNLQDLATVTGLLCNHNGKVVDTGPSIRMTDLDQIPSPYLTGVFDELVANNPTVRWATTIETNRGCPYQCTFCDWGSLTYNKVKKFGLERVFDELEWLGRNGFDHLSITDANFGMFVERDEMIVDKIIEIQDRYDNPKRVALGGWAKNQKSEVMKLAAKLFNHKGFNNNGLTVSVQTLDDHVLKTIKRQNLPMNRLREVFEMATFYDLPVTVEMILGLPGETKESWRQSVFKLFDLNQHGAVEFFQAHMLENAEMNTVQRNQYNIDTVTVYDYLQGSDDLDDGIKEGIKIVRSTTEMPLDDMIASLEFMWFVNTLHLGGPSQWFSRFLHKHSAITYDDFYTNLQDWLLQYDWWKDERQSITDAFRSWLVTGALGVEPIAGMKIHGWNYQHVTRIRMAVDNTYDLYHDAILEFARHRYSEMVPDTVLEDLSWISRYHTINFNNRHAYPKLLTLNHNVIDYVLDLEPLRAIKTEHRFNNPESPDMQLIEFIQYIVYKRRRNFGKSTIWTAAMETHKVQGLQH